MMAVEVPQNEKNFRGGGRMEGEKESVLLSVEKERIGKA